MYRYRGSIASPTAHPYNEIKRVGELILVDNNKKPCAIIFAQGFLLFCKHYLPINFTLFEISLSEMSSKLLVASREKQTRGSGGSSPRLPAGSPKASPLGVYRDIPPNGPGSRRIGESEVSTGKWEGPARKAGGVPFRGAGFSCGRNRFHG